MISLKDVEDEAFSNEMLGKGICIIPTGNEVVAPLSGTVTNLFPTLHAVGITSDDGVEVLIHIGMDTVKLNGQYFEAFVKQGDKVKEGQPLVRFNRDELLKMNMNLQTPVIITNSNDMEEVEACHQEMVHFNDIVIKIKK